MNKLILFTKYPTPGKVKTRLSKDLGIEKATLVHEELVELSLQLAEHLTKDLQLDFQIFYKGVQESEMKSWLGHQYSYQEQVEGDLGQKMKSAFLESFDQGFEKIFIIGSDCPFITPSILIEGYLKLSENDIVWGEAEDGGYYTIGLSKMIPEIFENIEWSTENVLPQSIEKALSVDASYSLLKKLRDIDQIGDYQFWKSQ